MIALQSFILIRHIIQKVFDVLVLHYLLLEEILPHFVKLQLASLYLAIYWLVQMDPEFFQEFQAVSQLNIRPKNHIEYFFVFHGAINEFLESLAWLPYVFPCGLSSFWPDIFVILRIINVQFLLLLVSDVDAAEVVWVGFLTLVVNGGSWVCSSG